MSRLTAPVLLGHVLGTSSARPHDTPRPNERAEAVAQRPGFSRVLRGPAGEPTGRGYLQVHNDPFILCIMPHHGALRKATGGMPRGGGEEAGSCSDAG